MQGQLSARDPIALEATRGPAEKMITAVGEEDRRCGQMLQTASARPEGSAGGRLRSWAVSSWHPNPF